MGISNSVGKIIKKLRKERGLTIEELAGRVNISKTYLSLIENQARNINIKRIDDIAQALGVPTAELLREHVEDAEDSSSTAEYLELSPRGASPENTIRIQMVELGEVYIGRKNTKKIIYRRVPLVSPDSDDDPGVFYTGEMPPGLASAEIDCPPDLDDLTAFALRMADDSMGPRVEKGDLLFACPSWKLRDHSMVLVKEAGLPATCRLAHRTESAFVLTAFNPSCEPRLAPADKVQWIYPVARLVANVYTAARGLNQKLF